MKNMIFLSLCVLTFIIALPTEETHSNQHTFLVKTDLTKEQVENLLNQYHRNHTSLIQETTQLHQNNTHSNGHQNETTQLKVKKKKKNKNAKQEMKPETPKEVPAEKPVEPEITEPQEATEPPEAPEVPEQEAPEAPEPPEGPEATEAPEAQEAPETPEVEKETTNLKKKTKQRDQKRIHQSIVQEVNNTQEMENEVDPENKTELLGKGYGNGYRSRNGSCLNQTVNLMSKPEKTEVKQNNSIIIGFLSAVFITFAFLSLFIYVTQPKGKKKMNETFKELTDYLLVKENQNDKYTLRDF